MDIRYDINELIKCDCFDAERALHNFRDPQAYYDSLTQYIDTWKHFLRSYNPTVVVHSPEMRSQFEAEVNQIEQLITPLEMQYVLTELENVKEGMRNSHIKAVSDGLQVFYAALEITAQYITSARMADSPAVKQPADKPLIFAVDDMPELLTTITSVLKEDYTIVAVTTGAAALTALQKQTPVLFLLDIEMPVMNGYELAVKIRENPAFAHTPIIFLTGNSSRENVLAAKALGANDYIVKPPEKNLLIKKIKTHLR